MRTRSITVCDKIDERILLEIVRRENQGERPTYSQVLNEFLATFLRETLEGINWRKAKPAAMDERHAEHRVNAKRFEAKIAAEAEERKQRLAAGIPEPKFQWSSPEAGKAARESIRAYAKERGKPDPFPEDGEG